MATGEMVSVEVALVEPGVIVAGEKEQLRVSGIPLQESAMGLLDVPDCIAAVTRMLPDFPNGRLISVGEALKAIVGAAGGVCGGVVVTVLGQLGS